MLQASVKRTWTENSQIYKLDLEKAEEPEIKLPTSVWIIEKARKFQENIYFYFTDYAKAFDCADHNKLVLKRQEYQTTWPASWENCMQVKKQQLESDMEQWTGSKLEKEYIKAILSSACLTYMHSTSGERLCWMKHKLESRFQEKYRPPQICRWYHPKGRKWRWTKEPLNEGGRGEWKSWLKTQHSKNWDHSIWLHHFMMNRWGQKWK